MRGNTLPLTLGLFLATGSAGAEGATRDGVTLPDSTEVSGKALPLNGIGIREATIFGVNVYVAGLYLEEKTSDPNVVITSNAPKRIVMHFVRDVGLEDITEAYREGFEKNADGKYATIEARVQRWNGFMSGMKDGDKMVVTYIPGKGTNVTIRNEDRGTIAGHDFSQVLFRIFVGPNPPNSDLKEGMLGKRR